MYFSRVISCSFHSRIFGFPSRGVVPGAVWEADAHLGLWACALSSRVTWARGLQPSELQRHEEYGVVTSQTAQEGEQLTDTLPGDW